jgi:cytochrome c oxidase cbb3-type subunit 3
MAAMNQHFACSVMGMLAFSLLCPLTACRDAQGGSTTTQTADNLAAESATGTAPLGQLAGAPAENAVALSTANPYEHNPQAIEQGRQLYIKMNCAGCHAYNGKGNMGPDLTDTYWRYGGLPIQIYSTIHDGRPQGMPAWKRALPPDEIWKLVSYIQSFGGTVPVSNYKHARQGDRPGDLIAPEAQADAQP